MLNFKDTHLKSENILWNETMMSKKNKKLSKYVQLNTVFIITADSSFSFHNRIQMRP